MTRAKKLIPWSYGAALVVVVGSIGPWASLGPFSVSGTSGDGVISLIAALVAAGLIWWFSGRPRRSKLISAAAAAIIALFVTGYDTVNISSVLNGAAIGWGVILAFLGSIALAALSIQLLWRHKTLVAELASRATVPSPATAGGEVPDPPPVAPMVDVGHGAETNEPTVILSADPDAAASVPPPGPSD